jgi:hypothetical protein
MLINTDGFTGFIMLQLIMATHAGMSTDEFEAIVKEWLATARHPRFNRPYKLEINGLFRP